jgi:4-diphosphocytidyl-2-C-methyl-D-erythritol kinase
VQDWIFEKACAKINLALHVLARRGDGYHELDSIVAFADVGDHLILRAAAATTLSITGPFSNSVPNGGDNIIFKALALLPDLLKKVVPPLEICLEKNLPVAAGVGGGSADAAAFIRAVLRLLDENLSATHITSLAKSLGADVPICIHQKACHMQGIGDIISPLTIEIPKAILLINPKMPCSTQAVFAKLGLKNGQNFMGLIEVENSPLWRNDLTEAACAVEPEISKVLFALEQENCFSAMRMSGSGATCFGLCNALATANAAAARLSVRNPNWWIKAAELI